MAVMGDLIPYFLRFERLLKSIAGSLCSPAQTVSTSAGTGNVPAGFRNVTITNTSDPDADVTITLSNGSTYVLTTGGQSFTNNIVGGDLLPAYTIAGPGTWQWHATT